MAMGARGARDGGHEVSPGHLANWMLVFLQPAKAAGSQPESLRDIVRFAASGFFDS